MEQIGKLRNRIDAIDRKIVKLLEKRVDTARRIGKIKKRNGLEITDLERERDVLENVSLNSKINKNLVNKIFRSIIEYCKDEEKN